MRSARNLEAAFKTYGKHQFKGKVAGEYLKKQGLSAVRGCCYGDYLSRVASHPILGHPGRPVVDRQAR